MDRLFVKLPGRQTWARGEGHERVGGQLVGLQARGQKQDQAEKDPKEVKAATGEEGVTG